MALPEAAQRGVQKAHALMREGQGQPPAPQPPTPGEPGPAAASDTAALQSQVENLTGEIRKLNAAHRTLRDKYDKEVPRLMSENDALKKRNDELEATAKRKVEAGTIESLADDERTLAGPMLPVMAKIAREVAAGEFETRIKPVSEKLASFERQHEASYYATLDMYVPGWDATDGSSISDDPKFLHWLQQLDPETNRTRWTLLKQAEAARQGHAVVEVITAFREGREIGARQPPKPSKQPPLDPGVDRDRPPPPADAPRGRTWTRVQIEQFYRDKPRLPEYQGVEGRAKAREVERDIFAASKEGRIVG